MSRDATHLIARLVLAGATITGFTLAGRQLVATGTAGFPAAVPDPPPAAQPPSALRPDSLASRVAARNPFRFSRTPSTWNRQVTSTMPPATPVAERPPRPALTLAGIILGDEPAALIEGLPGVEGTRVMRIGERWLDYQLREVTADHAVVAGSDTTWVLRVRPRP